MNTLKISALAFILVTTAHANTWLVRCDSSTSATAAPLIASLKAGGINVLATTLDRDVFRNRVCAGSTDTLIGVKVPTAEASRAEAQIPDLKAAPDGFSLPPRKVH